MKSMLRIIENRLLASNGKSLKNMSNVSLTRSCSYATKPPEMNMESKSETVSDDVNHNKKKVTNVWPTTDREINLFGPQDIRAPLNGNIGLAHTFIDSNNTINDLAQELNNSLVNKKLVDVDLMAMDPHFRQMKVIRDLSDHHFSNSYHKLCSDLMKFSQRLECVAHDCPQLLIRDFEDLFPISKRPDLTKGLTVVTYCQKTVNDMSGWTKEVDKEREQLMESFVSVAKNICDALKNEGFWADFIDPSSGRPFLGDYTNATMFETDERYRHFGFEIEDLGCCKVISHHIWGTHAFVGAIFTSAPINSNEIQKVLDICNVKTD